MLAPGQGMCYVDHTRDGRCSRQTIEMKFFDFLLMFEKFVKHHESDEDIAHP